MGIEAIDTKGQANEFMEGDNNLMNDYSFFQASNTSFF
jgi:hypothetical protein